MPSVRDMQWRTGVRVPLLLSDEIDSPVTFGFRSPRIILPLSFKNLSEPCQKAVLCHELLHVRRYDWILIVAEEVVGSLFWFHPASLVAAEPHSPQPGAGSRLRSRAINRQQAALSGFVAGIRAGAGASESRSGAAIFKRKSSRAARGAAAKGGFHESIETGCQHDQHILAFNGDHISGCRVVSFNGSAPGCAGTEFRGRSQSSTDNADPGRRQIFRNQN